MRKALIFILLSTPIATLEAQKFGTYWALYVTNAYQGPDTASAAVRQLDVGDPSIVVEQKDLYFISDKGEYIPTWAMTKNPPAISRKDFPRICLICSNRVQVRSKPGITGELKYFLEKGDSVIVMDETGYFYQLADSNFVRKADVQENPEFQGYGEFVSEYHSGEYHSYTYRKVNTWTTITEFRDQRNISVYRSRN